MGLPSLASLSRRMRATSLSNASLQASGQQGAMRAGCRLQSARNRGRPQLLTATQRSCLLNLRYAGCTIAHLPHRRSLIPPCISCAARRICAERHGTGGTVGACCSRQQRATAGHAARTPEGMSRSHPASRCQPLESGTACGAAGRAWSACSTAGAPASAMQPLVPLLTCAAVSTTRLCTKAPPHLCGHCLPALLRRRSAIHGCRLFAATTGAEQVSGRQQVEAPTLPPLQQQQPSPPRRVAPADHRRVRRAARGGGHAEGGPSLADPVTVCLLPNAPAHATASLPQAVPAQAAAFAPRHVGPRCLLFGWQQCRGSRHALAPPTNRAGPEGCGVSARAAHGRIACAVAAARVQTPLAAALDQRHACRGDEVGRWLPLGVSHEGSVEACTISVSIHPGPASPSGGDSVPDSSVGRPLAQARHSLAVQRRQPVPPGVVCAGIEL